MLTDSPYPATPMLWLLNAGTAYAGLSSKLLAQGIGTGEIPVSLKAIGPKRMRFVNVAELKAWLHGTNEPSVDLFAGTAK